MGRGRPFALASILLVVACGSSEDAPSDAGADDGGTGATDGRTEGSVTADGGSGSDGASGSEGGGNSEGGPSPDGGTSTRSAGCGTTPPHTMAFQGSATDGNGTMRTYTVLLPATYDANTALALTFAFHGAGGTSSSAEGFGIQGGAGAAASSIFVFPQGIAFQTYGVGWDDACGGRDMALFDHILSDIEAHYCVDTTRVFAAGFSWGCDYVTALTCCRGDRVRAVSAASCSDEFANHADYTTYANLACPTRSRTAIRFTHDASGGDGAYAVPLFATTSKLYQSFNACPAFTGTLPPNACHTYAGCAYPFIECPYTNLGHATPSGWGADTWSFFSSFH